MPLFFSAFAARIARRIALFVLATLFVATSARAAPFDLLGTDWEGCADFLRLAREELSDTRIVATDHIDYSTISREDSLILLHPEKTIDVASLTRFMHAGGRVILLDDFGTGDALLEHFELERIAIPEHPAEELRHNPELAIAVPAGLHPVVTDVDRVVTNHPTGLRHPGLSPVLKIVGTNGSPDVLIAVAGQVANGRLLVIGDPSIVINSMLRYPGNKAFAKGIVRYAGDDDTWGKRGGHVYVLSGAFEERGSFGQDEGAFAAFSEKFRALSDGISDVRRNGFPTWFSWIAAALVGSGVAAWVGKNAARTHKPTPPRFTRPIPLVAQGGVAGHAAVLGAQKTARALAMLEMKSALEDEFSNLLGLERSPGHDALAAKIMSEGLLDSSRVVELKALFLRMANIETMVLSRQASGFGKIADSEVVVTANTIRGLLESARKAADAKGLT